MKTKLFFILIALYCTASTANSQIPAIEGRWVMDSVCITKSINGILEEKVYKINEPFESIGYIFAEISFDKENVSFKTRDEWGDSGAYTLLEDILSIELSVATVTYIVSFSNGVLIISETVNYPDDKGEVKVEYKHFGHLAN